MELQVLCYIASKYRKKVFYSSKRLEMGAILIQQMTLEDFDPLGSK